MWFWGTSFLLSEQWKSLSFKMFRYYMCLNTDIWERQLYRNNAWQRNGQADRYLQTVVVQKQLKLQICMLIGERQEQDCQTERPNWMIINVMSAHCSILVTDSSVERGVFVIWMSSALYCFVFIHTDRAPSPHRANGSISADIYKQCTFTAHVCTHVRRNIQGKQPVKLLPPLVLSFPLPPIPNPWTPSNENKMFLFSQDRG